MSLVPSEYELAIIAYNKAQAIFFPIRDKYRHGLITDDNFLKAQKEYKIATAIYDTAYLLEQNQGD